MAEDNGEEEEDDAPAEGEEDDPGEEAGADDAYQGPVDENDEGVAMVVSDGAPGFGISPEGLSLLRARGKDYSTDNEGRDVPRMDPDLVALVLESGDQMAGSGATLVVRRIPREAYDSKAYRIYESDGKEFLAIDPGAYGKQLGELRSKVEEQEGALEKFFAAMHNLLYQGEQSNEERLSRLREMAPAEMLRTRPSECLAALADRAQSP